MFAFISNLEPMTLIAIGMTVLLTLGVITTMLDDPTKKLRLVSLGVYKGSDLSRYFIDQNGDLYSRNKDSWEINPVKHQDLLKLSNNSTDKSGQIVNSFRDVKGNKITIRRNNFNYYTLRGCYGYIDLVVSPVGARHLRVLAKKSRGLYGIN